MAKWLYNLAQGVAKHRRGVLFAWMAALVVVAALGTAFKGETSDSFTIPGIESQQAIDLLADEFPMANAGTVRAVFVAPEGGTLSDTAIDAAIASSLAEAGRVAGVITVTPLTTSQNGTIGFADVIFANEAAEIPEGAVDSVLASMDPARDAGMQVEFGGTAVSTTPEVGGVAELIGIAIAFIVLLFTLGTVIAAGLPLVTALVGVGIGIMGVQIVSGFVDMPSAGNSLAMMIGLAVGIDYALFIVARYRELLTDPIMTVTEGIGRALGTAGSAVVFAGLTVVIALSALTVVGIPFLTIMGLSAAATVLIAVLVALTLVPAVLALAGERLRPRAKSEPVAKAEPVAETRSPRKSVWLQWGLLIQKAPAAVLVVGIVLLGFLAIPVTHMRLGLPGNEVQPVESTLHQSYKLLTEGFGEGFNSTIIHVVDTTGVPDDERAGVVEQVGALIEQDSNVAMVTAPTFNESQTITILNVVPFTGPDDNATTELVERLRGEPAALLEQAGGSAYVTGVTAIGIDVSEKLADALPLFIGIIVVLAMILLVVAFRSLVVPLKAVVGFLFTIAVSLGLTVWIFQDGNLMGAFGVATASPIVSFVPIILIGVLFGLAMDYEVFLVSRMRERFQHGDDAPGAVLHGLEQSGRVVCAAALIMAAVFGGFMFLDDPIIKSIAFALTVGVLVDAFVVRMTLVPSVMFLLGDRAWSLPAWLDRIVPNVDLEGTSLPAHGGDYPRNAEAHVPSVSTAD